MKDRKVEKSQRSVLSKKVLWVELIPTKVAADVVVTERLNFTRNKVAPRNADRYESGDYNWMAEQGLTLNWPAKRN
jgi:hypothetical protein